jgi:hypothetical protein
MSSEIANSPDKVAKWRPTTPSTTTGNDHGVCRPTRQHRAAQGRHPRPDRPSLATGPKPWIVPIRGTSKLHRLEENIGAADIDFSADELTEIEDAASKIQIQGGRYNEAQERMTNL